MTIFWINGKPHLSVHSGFQIISEYQYYTMLEHGEIEEIQEVELYV